MKEIELLSLIKRHDISDLVYDFKIIFPGKTTAAQHDVNVGHARPIKQHPHRLNPIKVQHIRN